jgi:hypothetical protein
VRPTRVALEKAQLLVMRERLAQEPPAVTDPRVIEVASLPADQLRRRHSLAVKASTATTTREIRRNKFR